MQIITTRRYHFTPTRMVTIKKTHINKCWQGCGGIGTLTPCWWEEKMVQPFGKTVWQFLKEPAPVAGPSLCSAAASQWAPRGAGWMPLALAAPPPLATSIWGARLLPSGSLPDHQASQGQIPSCAPVGHKLLAGVRSLALWVWYWPGSILRVAPAFTWPMSAPLGGLGEKKQGLASEGGPWPFGVTWGGAPLQPVSSVQFSGPQPPVTSDPRRQKLQRPQLIIRRFCPLEKAFIKNSNFAKTGLAQR